MTTLTVQKVYENTKNPSNVTNILLHQRRFRESVDNGLTTEEQRAAFSTLYATKEWTKTHVDLHDLNVIQFAIHRQTQRLLHDLQLVLVDAPYVAFGKTPESWEGYTLMYRNGFPSGDHRKPVTDVFETFWLSVYCPIVFDLLFGRDGYAEMKHHVSQFKSCTIKVTESDTAFYGDNVFHMHIDGKIGMRQDNNHAQSRMSRMLFSIVTDTLDHPELVSHRDYGTTCYPIWQPRVGFHSNKGFHKYMHELYIDRGLENSGLPRPHYEIPEELIFRAESGQVLWHNSHADKTTPQAIHSEPNPCPDRHLYVFDFKNLIQQDENGKFLPSIDIPMDMIVNHMRVLGEHGTEAFDKRLDDAILTASGLLDHASQFPNGRTIVQDAIRILTAAKKPQ